MKKQQTKKINPFVIGLLQSSGVVIYCGLVAMLFYLSEKYAIYPQGFWAIVFVLILLVFSAGITGAMVFGYSAYLMIHKKLKRALEVLSFTFLNLIIIVLLLLMISFS